MPVFPPTLASTMANRVVGMLMKLMPRLKVEAAKPPRSVTMPPPRLMSSEWRVAPFDCSWSQTWHTLSSPLCSSPAAMVISSAPRRHKAFSTAGQQATAVVSSASTKMRSCSHSAMAMAKSLCKFPEITILCSITNYLYIENDGLQADLSETTTHHKNHRNAFPPAKIRKIFHKSSFSCYNS